MTTPNGVALVVGAGDGLGSAVARRFARGGYVAVLARRGGEKLEAACKAIEAAGGRTPSASTRGARTRCWTSSTASNASSVRSRWRSTTSAPT